MPYSLFNEAKRLIAADPERYFPGGERRGADYFFSRRTDDKTPSCHILETGAAKDFGDDGFRGSGVDVYAEIHSMSARDAAEEIVRLGGGSIPERSRPSRKKEKVKPVVPAPPEALETLRAYVRSEWATEHYGEAVLGSKYMDAEGRVLFCIARYERAGKKTIRPYYYGEDGKWHEGQALPSGRPVLHLPEIVASALPVLVVEGEKCAEVKVPGYVVTTWAGGSSIVDATDWATLASREVVVWPDADPPGRKAGMALKRRLPHARLLDIQGRPQGWDIANAQAEGLDLAAFISSCTVVEDAAETGRLPFALLGYDSARHYFLPYNRRVLFSIDMGHFTASQLLELAPLRWWGDQNLCKDTGAIRVDQAQDWLLKLYEDMHIKYVDLRRLRGAGVWRDGDQIVVNDGAAIVTMAGERVEYDAYKSAIGAKYIPSETRFGDMTGEEATDAEGAELVALFCSQKFSRALDPLAALGWALIAPFGGLLRWRPHLWITGRRGTGKSTVLIEKLIDPLIGEFAYEGTGRTSEPALRRAGHLTARPYRLDEFDTRAKSDLERLSRIVNLIRNSSCDSTAVTTLASGDSGTVTFIVRSCFCLVSVNVLDMDAAIESRFVRIEKLPVDDISVEMERMKGECSHVMADPARYRRRIFRALPRILSDITSIHDQLLSYLGDAREADVIAPLLCAAWAVQSGESIMGEAGIAWCSKLLADMSAMHADRVEDEDRVIQNILEAQVKGDDMKTRTVAELLGAADSMEGGQIEARALLERHGVKLASIKNGDGKLHRYLAIAQHSKEIEHMLAGTPYEHGYEQQIRRHVLCKDGEAVVVKIAGKSTRCRCLDWEGFRGQYLAEEQGRLGVEK